MAEAAALTLAAKYHQPATNEPGVLDGQSNSSQFLQWRQYGLPTGLENQTSYTKTHQ